MLAIMDTMNGLTMCNDDDKCDDENVGDKGGFGKRVALLRVVLPLILMRGISCQRDELTQDEVCWQWWCHCYCCDGKTRTKLLLLVTRTLIVSVKS